MYAIRAVLFIASKEREIFVPIREISDELKISFHFLTKILQHLTQKQVLTSYQGPNGGIALAKPGNEITLLDLIKIIEGDDLFTLCVLGLPGCGDDTPCPLHEKWQYYRQNLEDTFKDTSIDDLVNKMESSDLRISIE